MALAVACLPLAAAAQQSMAAAAPAVYTLSGLYRTADIVAVVHIVSGDTENYRNAIYKATVVQEFQGCGPGADAVYRPL